MGPKLGQNLFVLNDFFFFPNWGSNTDFTFVVIYLIIYAPLPFSEDAVNSLNHWVAQIHKFKFQITAQGALGRRSKISV
jgi:hypothetical protein